MKKFLLVDDHAVVRSGMNMWLSEEYKPLEIDEAENGNTTIEKISKNNYDLLLLDIQMPDTNTLDLLKYILIIKPSTKVLVFSMNSETVYGKRFLKAGAKGFLSKAAPLDEIKKAISLILNNRRYYSDSFMETILNDNEEIKNPLETLSDREFEIANLLLEGKTLSEISSLLNIQNSTTGTHKARIFEKLKVNNVLELTRLAASYDEKSPAG